MYSLLTFDSQQKKKPAREKKLEKKRRETSCSALFPSPLSRMMSNCRGFALVPPCLGFEFRSHCQSFCSDFTVALSKTEKTSSVQWGDSVIFVVLRYVSIRFNSFHFVSFQFCFSLSVCVQIVFPIVLTLPAIPPPYPFPPCGCVAATVLTHKFALICCKIISFIYVLPFTWRYAVDNLFKRRHRRGATNLNKINYQTVTLTYRPGRLAGKRGWKGVSHTAAKEQVVKA